MTEFSEATSNQVRVMSNSIFTLFTVVASDIINWMILHNNVGFLAISNSTMYQKLCLQKEMAHKSRVITVLTLKATISLSFLLYHQQMLKTWSCMSLLLWNCDVSSICYFSKLFFLDHSCLLFCIIVIFIDFFWSRTQKGTISHSDMQKCS